MKVFRKLKRFKTKLVTCKGNSGIKELFHYIKVTKKNPCKALVVFSIEDLLTFKNKKPAAHIFPKNMNKLIDFRSLCGHYMQRKY